MKCREYNIALCIAFVDYEKAFDSVQNQGVLTALQEQGIVDVYIELFKEIYTKSSMTVHLHKGSNKINTRRGVRQEDTISPKLFTAALESIYRRRNMGTHHPSKEQASGRTTNKDGKEYVRHHIPRQKNKHIWVKEKQRSQTCLTKSKDGSGPGQCTSAGYEITDERCVSPLRNHTKGKDLEEVRRDGGETN